MANVIFGLYAAIRLANSLTKSDNFYDRLINKTVVILLFGGLSFIPGMGFCAAIYVHGNSIMMKIEKWQRELLK